VGERRTLLTIEAYGNSMRVVLYGEGAIGVAEEILSALRRGVAEVSLHEIE
jgi:hypothetical protein